MDITKKVAKARFFYHANMLDIVNVLNQLSILKDDKAESAAAFHVMSCFDCISRVTGKSIEELCEKFKKFNK